MASEEVQHCHGLRLWIPWDRNRAVHRVGGSGKAVCGGCAAGHGTDDGVVDNAVETERRLDKRVGLLHGCQVGRRVSGCAAALI